MDLIPATFSLGDSPAFSGYRNPEDKTWNGFARPYFTREQVDALRAYLLTEEIVVSYVYEDRSFVARSYITGESTIAHPIATPLGEVYPLGAGAWCWE